MTYQEETKHVHAGEPHKSKEHGEFVGKRVSFAMIAAAVIVLAYQLVTLVSGTPAGSSGVVNVDRITSEVLPDEGFVIDAVWKDKVHKMVQEGAIDPEKLEAIITKRYGQEMKPEWKRLLEAEYSGEKMKIDAENSVFMMYLLWAFAKHNENELPLKSPFASSFKNYDIGVGRAGYGDVKLLSLSPEQQALLEDVAMNSYRPCCGQPAGRPDCSHGFAALGLMEIMAEQGFSKEEIFDAFVKFNSFWFPSTYIQNAIYFEATQGVSWEDVDKELVAGKDYSSLSGAYNVKKELQDLGI